MMNCWRRMAWGGLVAFGFLCSNLPAPGGEVTDFIRALLATDSADTNGEEDFHATHQQARLIQVFADDESTTGQLKTFCLDERGRVLAAVTADPGEIRIFDPQGKALASWQIPVAPDAINLAPDGSILLAGEGELLRLDSEGNVLTRAKAPHAKDSGEDTAKLRKQAAEQIAQIGKSMREQRDQMLSQIQQLRNVTPEQAQELTLLEAAIARTADRREGDLTDLEREQVALRRKLVRSLRDGIEAGVPEGNRQAIEQLGLQLEAYENYLADYSEDPSDEQIDAHLRATRQQKMAVSSISATQDAVFVATPAQVGHGFAVWRTDSDFADGEEIVSGLRGCCGQMDVQACDGGVYVAENARHRICQYDADGELVHTWGKRARRGVRGFGGCCNPMNVAFGSDGSVYAAESSTGRIKRYSPEGELTELIGSVELVPGCKKVSIAVSPDDQYVYMLDITRNHIVVMERNTPAEAALAQE